MLIINIIIIISERLPVCLSEHVGVYSEDLFYSSTVHIWGTRTFIPPQPVLIESLQKPKLIWKDDIYTLLQSEVFTYPLS